MKKITRDDFDKFWSKRTREKNPRVATHFKNDDTHLYDIRLVKKHINKDSIVLDLACGTCIIANAITKYCKQILAVDKYSEFLKYCVVNEKLSVIKSDILDFKPERNSYDLVLMFGVAHYFFDAELDETYKYLHESLKIGGKLIVKHASGVEEDVIVADRSEQIGDDYFAIYRSKNKDIKMLEKYFKVVEVLDIYPSRLNKWKNTHYFAYICEKRQNKSI